MATNDFYNSNISPAEIRDLLKDMEQMAHLGDELERQIKKVSGKLDKIEADVKTPESFNRKPFSFELRQKKDDGCITTSKIIPFPGAVKIKAESGNHGLEKSAPVIMAPVMALPGEPIPTGFRDYRSVLQRDGLILLAWDKRVMEKGERYTAYWVTSIGTPRFYASKPLDIVDFPLARPDHKSYAAEDGVEFYGQEAPAYIVHVAPELMMSNPLHAELRLAYIKKLKDLGCEVNFDYKYLLKTEKTAHCRPNNDKNDPRGRVS